MLANTPHTLLCSLLAAAFAAGALACGKKAAEPTDPPHSPALVAPSQLEPEQQAVGALAAAGGSSAQPAWSASDTQTLLYVREEEKLARDVYTALSRRFPLRVFDNIRGAEQRHTQEIADLIAAAQLPDPADGRGPGQFQNAKLQELYSSLVAQGEPSAIAALGVGLAIEEMDIVDLEERIATADNRALRATLQQLLRGSRNHLRAFSRNLSRRGVTPAPRHLSQEKFDSILAGPHEPGSCPDCPRR